MLTPRGVYQSQYGIFENVIALIRFPGAFLWTFAYRWWSYTEERWPGFKTTCDSVSKSCLIINVMTQYNKMYISLSARVYKQNQITKKTKQCVKYKLNLRKSRLCKTCISKNISSIFRYCKNIFFFRNRQDVSFVVLGHKCTKSITLSSLVELMRNAETVYIKVLHHYPPL